MAVDDYYYRLLGVHSGASEIELKRAYRIKAIWNHPDKNPNDPDAGAKFQAIAEAYHILSDPALRRLYDERGRGGVKDGERLIDPVALFAQIFGGQSFEPWVGKLSLMKVIVEQIELEAAQKRSRDARLQSLSDLVPDARLMIHDGRLSANSRASNSASYFEDWKESQRQEIHKHSDIERKKQMRDFDSAKERDKSERIEYITQQLLAKLSALPHVASADQVRDFVLSLELVRETLKLESFGVPLLHTIADVYRDRAVAFIDYCKWSYLGTAFHYSKDFFGTIRSTVTALKAANEATTALKLASGPGTDKSDDSPSHAMKSDHDPGHRVYSRLPNQEDLERLVAGKVVAMAWEASSLELRSILKVVCDRILYDQESATVDSMHYAKTMIMIADVFQQAQEDLEDGKGTHTFEQLVLSASKVKAADIVREVQAKSAMNEVSVPQMAAVQ